MGKPVQDAMGAGPAASLLSSVAGLLESGMVGVFGTGNNGGGNRASMSRDVGVTDKICTKWDCAPSVANSSPRINMHVKSSSREKNLDSKQASEDSGSDDMPELERLGRSTCPASSEEEETLPASSMPESHIVRRDPGRGDGMVSSEMFGANEAPNSSRGSKISTNLDGRKPAFSSSGGFSASEAKAGNGDNSSALIDRSAAAARVPPSKLAPASNPTRWNRPALSTSCASTLIAGMSPDTVPATVGTVGSDSGAWRMNRCGGIGKSDLDEGMTPAASGTTMRSESGGFTKSTKPVPFPLDLNAIAAPIPPRGVHNSKSGAWRSSKPVVLAGPALQQLERIRRAKGTGVGGGPGLGVKTLETGSGGLKETVVRASAEPDAPRGGLDGGRRIGVRAIDDSYDSIFDVEGISVEMKRALGERTVPPLPSPPAQCGWKPATQDEHSDDAAPPACSPRLSGHLRRPPPREGGSGLAKVQNGRSRAAFRGRGARPATWTEKDAEGSSLSPSPRPEGTGSKAFAAVNETSHMRLVRQAPGAGCEAQPGGNISPGGLSITSGGASSRAEGVGDSAALPSIKYGRGSPTTERGSSKVSSSMLAEVAADITLRGSMAGVELVPGLGRSAFEHISTSRATLPVRELATAKAVTAVVQNDGAEISEGGTKASSQQRKLSTGAQLNKLTEGSNRWLDADLNKTRSVLSEEQRSRSRVVDTDAPSKVPAILHHHPHASGMPILSPPSLNQPHAPGQVFRPMPQQRQSLPKGGIGCAKIPPFRLSSSNRLTSFDSSRKGSPTPGKYTSLESASANNNETAREYGASNADNGGKRGLSMGSHRSAPIDMLSSFGSNSAQENAGLRSRSSSRSNSRSRSRSRSRPSPGPLRMDTLTSHAEELVADDIVGPSAGVNDQESWRHGSAGVDARRSHRGRNLESGERKRRSFGGGDEASGDPRSRSGSSRRSRSRGSSTGSATRRLLSQGSEALSDRRSEKVDETRISSKNSRHRNSSGGGASGSRRHSHHGESRRYEPESTPSSRQSSRAHCSSSDSRRKSTGKSPVSGSSQGGHHRRRTSGGISDMSMQGRDCAEIGDSGITSGFKSGGRHRPSSSAAELESERRSHRSHGGHGRHTERAGRPAGRSADDRDSHHRRRSSDRRAREGDRRREGSSKNRGHQTEYHSDHEGFSRREKVKVNERQAVSERDLISEIERDLGPAANAKRASSRYESGGHCSSRRSSRRRSRDGRSGGDGADDTKLLVTGRQSKSVTDKTLQSTHRGNSIIHSPGSRGRPGSSSGIPVLGGRKHERSTSRRQASSVGSDRIRLSKYASSNCSDEGYDGASHVVGHGGCGAGFTSRFIRMFVCSKDMDADSSAQAAAAAARRVAEARDQVYSGSFHKTEIVHGRATGHDLPTAALAVEENYVHGTTEGREREGGVGGTCLPTRSIFAGTDNRNSRGKKGSHGAKEPAGMSSLGPSPPKGRFGTGPNGRDLSQFYGSPCSIVNGKLESEMRNDSVASGNGMGVHPSASEGPLSRRGGEEIGLEEGGLRVQHLLRTSQLHSVRSKTTSVRSDSSCEIVTTSSVVGSRAIRLSQR